MDGPRFGRPNTANLRDQGAERRHFRRNYAVNPPILQALNLQGLVFQTMLIDPRQEETGFLLALWVFQNKQRHAEVELVARRSIAGDGGCLNSASGRENSIMSVAICTTARC